MMSHREATLDALHTHGAQTLLRWMANDLKRQENMPPSWRPAANRNVQRMLDAADLIEKDDGSN